MAHIILFDHAGFRGVHRHVFTAENNLNAADDRLFENKVSSMVILEGRWDFFINAGFQGKLGGTLPPGQYPWVEAALGSGSNDAISSLRPV